MITIQDLKTKSASRYESTLKKLLIGENPFPVTIPYKRPRRGGDPTLILRMKEMLRSQSKEKVGFGPTIQFNETKTRRYGSGSLPGVITFDTLEDLTRYIGKKAEAERILQHANIVAHDFPTIRPWTATRLEILANKDAHTWSGIAKVVAYFIQNPKPWIYPREVSLKLHTKFIEQNYKPIIEILAQVSPDSLNDPYTNWQDRLGLRSSSEMIEGRFLDFRLAPHLPQHLIVPVKEWNRCTFAIPTWVLIIENRTCLLTLPVLPGCLALLGKGYAVTRLAEIEKLHQTKIYYWGDIDQHGFEILASIRNHLPKTVSFLMDEETLVRCCSQVGSENVMPTLAADFVDAHLTPTEKTLWKKCADDHLRLEQELIPRGITISALEILAASSSAPSDCP